MGLFAKTRTNNTSISPQKAYQMMEESNKKGDKYALLDVRTMSEYKQFRIDGATLIPLNELTSRAQLDLPNKDVLIFIYCYSGARAARATKMLSYMGYPNIYNLGGIINWPYGTAQG